MRICAWCYADLSAATNSQRVFCDHTCRNRAKAKRGRVAARKGKKPMLYRRLNGYG